MNVLFIGGTGIISSACTQLALARGIEITLLNRGNNTTRPAPVDTRILHADIRDPQSVRAALQGAHFDAVVDWIAFTPEHIRTDLDLFRDNTAQYIFISSASVYQKPPSYVPVSESAMLDNPFWQYSRDKIACEELLVQAYRETKFPMTIVRPSHTYDKTTLPFDGGYTTLRRMMDGKKVIVHGDGTSLWTLTHHQDFAKGFVGLLGLPAAVGDAIHITSDEWLTWNQIFESMARAAGTTPRMVHIPTELINAYAPNWGAGMLGDKMHSMIFDNSKIKRLVPDFCASIPFARGAEEIVTWFAADPARQKIDEKVNQLQDTLIAKYESIWP